MSMCNPHVRGRDEVQEPPERSLLQEVEDLPKVAEEPPELAEVEELGVVPLLAPLLLVLLLLLLGTAGRPLGVPLVESLLVLLLLFPLVPLVRSPRFLRRRLGPEETERPLEAEPIKLEPCLVAPLDRPP